MKMITKELKIRLTGIRPLLLCNGEMANPLNPQMIAIRPFVTKREKTEQEVRELAEMQFMAGLYYVPEIGPVMPVPNIHKMLQEGAAKNKKGPLFKSSLLVEGFVGKERDKAVAKLIYDGPIDPKKLYGNGNTKFVDQRTGRLRRSSTVLITRPIFPEWQIDFIAVFEEDTVSSLDVETAVTIAGRLCGIGTWRPFYGQFKAEIIK